MKKQVYNPFLPIYECVPDGEPHVFGDRVYLYGSHDKEGGETFCMLDYTTYSALKLPWNVPEFPNAAAAAKIVPQLHEVSTITAASMP